MPAESRFASTARITAASLAAELEFSIDGIEELQMGANELFAVLVELALNHQCEEITLRYIVHADQIDVRASTDVPDGTEVELDILARQILDAVVDSYSIDGGSALIRKRRAQ
jgi:hypothetical protein